MLRCPECGEGELALHEPLCRRCGWQARVDGEVLDVLSRDDRDSPLFSAYLALYEQIAEDDIASPIQGDDLLDLEAERLVDQLGPVSGAAVCDVGVGRGLIFNRLLAQRPRLLVGVDLASSYLHRLAPQDGSVALVRANAEALPFREEFDAIVASDVLEHVLNPADFLASLADSLAPDGRLIVKVPYRENLTQYRRSSGCPYPMVHLRTFDRPLLRQALRDVGLEVERMGYSGFFPDRWHAPIARFPRAAHLLGLLLKRACGTTGGALRISPRLGTLLMRPVVITALARKRSSARVA